VYPLGIFSLKCGTAHVSLHWNHITSHRFRYVGVIAFALLFVAASVIYSSAVVPTYESLLVKSRAALSVAEWIKMNIDEDSTVAAWDTGKWAYFSDRPIINLDGLVNDHEFFEEYLQEDRIDEYLLQENVSYIITWTGKFDQCGKNRVDACINGDVVYLIPNWESKFGNRGMKILSLSDQG